MKIVFTLLLSSFFVSPLFGQDMTAVQKLLKQHYWQVAEARLAEDTTIIYYKRNRAFNTYNFDRHYRFFKGKDSVIAQKNDYFEFGRYTLSDKQITIRFTLNYGTVLTHQLEDFSINDNRISYVETVYNEAVKLFSYKITVEPCKKTSALFSPRQMREQLKNKMRILFLGPAKEILKDKRIELLVNGNLQLELKTDDKGYVTAYFPTGWFENDHLRLYFRYNGMLTNRVLALKDFPFLHSKIQFEEEKSSKEGERKVNKRE
jgi:hypothetical protein